MFGCLLPFVWMILFWIPCPGGFQRFPQTSYPPGSAKLDSCRKWRRKFSKEAPQVLLWKHLGPGVSTCFNRKFSGTSAILCAPQIRIQCEVPADALTNGSEQLEEAWGSTDLGEHGFSPMFSIKYYPPSVTDVPKKAVTDFPTTEPVFQKPNHFFTKSGASFFGLERSQSFPNMYFLLLLQIGISTHGRAPHPNETTEFGRKKQNWTKIMFTRLNTCALSFHFQGFPNGFSFQAFGCNLLSRWISFPDCMGFMISFPSPVCFFTKQLDLCFTRFVFLLVSSFLFKPMQVLQFLRWQLQTLDITMFTVFSSTLEFVSR